MSLFLIPVKLNKPAACGLESVETKLSECLREGHDRVILDLAGISVLESAHIGLFARWARNFQSVEGQLHLVGVDASMRQFLALAGLRDVCPMFEDWKSLESHNAGEELLYEDSAGKVQRQILKSQTPTLRKSSVTEEVIQGFDVEAEELLPDDDAFVTAPGPDYNVTHKLPFLRRARARKGSGVKSAADGQSDSSSIHENLESERLPDSFLEEALNQVTQELPDWSMGDDDRHNGEDDEAQTSHITLAFENTLGGSLPMPEADMERASEAEGPNEATEPEALAAETEGEPEPETETIAPAQTNSQIESESKLETEIEIDEDDFDEALVRDVSQMVEATGEYQCLGCGKDELFLKGYPFVPCTSESCPGTSDGWYPTFDLF